MKLTLSLIILVVLVPVLDVYAQTIGSDSPSERSFQDVKFTNAYFGTIGYKIEVEPGDKNVPFTVVFANVGSSDITGVKGQLSMPLGFNAADGTKSIIYADSGQEVLGGRYFSLTFYVNIRQKHSDPRISRNNDAPSSVSVGACASS